jgi:glycosyltransferase involved in cell wall biosynthesis
MALNLPCSGLVQHLHMLNLPKVSVVIAAHGEAAELEPTIQSVLSQTERSLECIIVCDGCLSSSAHHKLCAMAACDNRIYIIEQHSAGLTRALMRGCAAARGNWIARLDVGDEMQPQRLAKQLDVLEAHPDCVLATSDVDVYGPAWEYIRTDRAKQVLGIPRRVDAIPPAEGIEMLIPHHASVTFRRDAYEYAGGYRSEFYYGQDWDLWFRLARVGTFVHLPVALTRVRIFPTGLSSLNSHSQRRIGKLSLSCYIARCSGKSESSFLLRAKRIRPGPIPIKQILLYLRRADGFYFIAESLRRNGDPRCRHYFVLALRLGFWRPRILVRTFMSFSFPLRSAFYQK